MTTTLAKGLGCYGGAVIGRRALIDTVRAQSDVYRRSTPVPTPIAMAARAALAVLRDEPQLIDVLRANTQQCREALARCGVAVHQDPVPVFTFILDGGTERMVRVHERLHAQGIYAPLIEYPGGPSPRYFRLTVTAQHTAQQIARLGIELDAAMKMTA